MRKNRVQSLAQVPGLMAAQYIEAMPTRLRTWLSTHLPCQCQACHAWGAGGPLCPACQSAFAPRPLPRCPGCGLRQAQAQAHTNTHTRLCGACLRQPPPWQHCHVAVDYGYPWAGLISRWKLGQQPALAAHLLRYLLLPQAPIMAAVAAADALIPMPLATQRLRERGYNQSAQITQLLAPDKHRPQWLLRQQHTHSQRGLNRAQRLHNLAQAFHSPAQAQASTSKLLLVDDVMTTGASLHAACQALRAAGFAHIEVLCLARTPAPTTYAD